MQDALLRSQLNELEKLLFSALKLTKDSKELCKRLDELDLKIKDMLVVTNSDKEVMQAFIHEAKKRQLLNTVNSLKRALLSLQNGIQKNTKSIGDFSILLERFRDTRTYVFPDKALAIKFIEKLLYYWNEQSAVLTLRMHGLFEKDVLDDLCKSKCDRGYEIAANKIGKAIVKLFGSGVREFTLECDECKLAWLSENVISASAKPERIKELDAIALTQNALLK
jgi:hypothetical protein